MQLEQRRFQRNLYLRVVGMWLGVRQEAGSSPLHTTTRKKGLVALPHMRWVKENSAASRGLPPSSKAIELTLHLLPFPVQRDTDASFTSCEGGERDKRPTQSCLDLLTSRSGRDSAGSVTTSEERDRADTVILF